MQLVHSTVGLSLGHTIGSKSPGQTTGTQSTSQRRSSFQQLSLQEAEDPSGATWICFKRDHMAVVELLKSQTSQGQLLMHLLSFLAAYFRYQLGNPHARHSE